MKKSDLKFNHEKWRKCPRCGDYNDIRIAPSCLNCGELLIINQSKNTDL